MDLSKFHILMDAQILREKTLESSFQSFQKQFPKTHQFQAAYEILAWLIDDLLSQSERVNGIYILLEYSRISENAFLQSVADLVDLSPNPWEKLLLQEWTKNKEIGKSSVSAILKLTGEAKELEHIKKSRTVRPVINGGSSDKSSTFLGKYDPEFLRPIPDFIEISPNETNWMSPMTVPEVHWNNQGQSNSADNDLVREYLKLSLQQKLTIDQYNFVISALKQNKKLLSLGGISHKSLAELVEKNSGLAVEIMVLIMNSTRIQDYFGELVNIPMSINVLEVVNKLAMTMDLPAEFLHLFISNYMNSCKSIKEKYNQTRFVRLLCVFMSALLKNKILNNEDLYMEIEHFCTEFSSIKEASSVYRTIKSLPND